MSSEELLAREFVQAHPVDSSRVLEQLPVENIAGFLSEIQPNTAARVSTPMTPAVAARCLERMDAEKAAALAGNLSVEITAVLLRRVERAKREAILRIMSDTMRDAVGLVLRYPEGTAGSLMDPQVFTLFEESSVGDALEQIQRDPRHLFCHIPVLDREHAFKGLISFNELLVSEREAPVASVMHRGVGWLSPRASAEAILSHPGWRTYHDLTVVDERGLFLGLLSYRTVRRLEDERPERMPALSAFDAGKALGELYWVGMSAFFKGVASLVDPEARPQTPAKGDR